ncbi:YajQ family cyclic di-GMP-binding protein [Lancefieldella rimae]|uniref:YajQ family cyclic di-GMP-binding protein n=1 Tax=Lancefieldella rimae TaxID=1383 RepID=UPI003A8D7355
MAKESSFDVVSEVDLMEVDNAYQQAVRELSQRYDLKDSGATLELSKKEGTFTITAPADFVAAQVRDVLGSKLVKRGIDLKSVRWKDPIAAAGSTVRQTGALVQGIDQETAKRIAKDIRDMKVKAKATVEGNKLRVTSASRDTLQSFIAFLKEQENGQPLQYTNYR